MNSAETNRLLRYCFFAFIVRPAVLIALGLNVRRRERLPAKGPAIVVANHNSHLDTLALMTLFPGRVLESVRPVAAADYFLSGPKMAWFALNIIGILPLARTGLSHKADPLEACEAALNEGKILIVYPEGSRGEPEQMGPFKTGLAHMAKRCPQAPVIPVFMHGLGKVLPKGEWLPVPFFCDVFVGEPIHWEGDRREFMEKVEGAFRDLAAEGHFPAWG